METHRAYARIRRQGFTLIELIVVVAIIGVLATLVIVRYAGKTDQAKVATARAQITQLEGAVIEFQAHCGRYPQSLDELVNKPSDCENWQSGGYLKGKRVPRDPWGHEFIYRQQDAEPLIVCLGADGREGGEGSARDLDNFGPDGSN